MDRGRAGEVYNVSSGEGIAVGALATEVLTRAGVTAAIKSRDTLRRAGEVPFLIGDSTKLRLDTGWKPHRTRTDIIDDLLYAPS